MISRAGPARAAGLPVHLAGAASTAACLTAAVWSHSSERPPLIAFFALLAAAAAAMLFVSLRLRSASPATGLAAIAGWAIVLRAIAFAGLPLYEDDYFRYLWDGRQFVETGTPYGKAPEQFLADPSLSPEFRRIVTRINSPEVPTIYGPVCQLTFAAAYRLAPGRVWPLQLLYILADLGLLALLALRRIPAAHLVLYAWSPLVLKEIAFTAHTDVLMAFFGVLALLLSESRRPALAGIALGLALGSKLTAIVLAPLFLTGRWWRTAVACGLTLAALYLPFVTGRTEAAGLAEFLGRWEFNSFGFAAWNWLLPAPWGRFGAALSIAAFAGWTVRSFRREPARRFELARNLLGVFFLFAPVVNPWYLVILAALNALQPAGWATAATLSVLLSYATGNNLPGSGLPDYNHPDWVRPAEFLPVLVALAVPLSRFRSAGTASECGSRG